MKYTPILDHFKDVNSCHPSDLEQIFFNAPGIHFSYLLLSTVKQHFQKTGLDWVFGRKDLQGFNIASASSLWELDILQLQFHHSVWIPVAQCVHTMAFDTYYRRVSYIKPSWSNLSIWQVATSKLVNGWLAREEKKVFQAALRMVVVKDSRWNVGEIFMNYGRIWYENVRLIKKILFDKGVRWHTYLVTTERKGRREREKKRERENEGDVPWQIFFCVVVVVCLGLAPFLSGLLFSLGEMQIWLGDLRVVVVVGPGCFMVDFDLPAFIFQLCPYTNVFLTTYALVRTEP